MFEQQKKMKAKVTHIYNRLNNSEDPSESSKKTK